MSIWISPGRGEVTMGGMGLLPTTCVKTKFESKKYKSSLGFQKNLAEGIGEKRRFYGGTSLKGGMVASTRFSSSHTMFQLCSTMARAIAADATFS